MNINVIGLGKLGLPMAALFSNSGISVLGIDVDKEKLDAIKRGVCPIPEPGIRFNPFLSVTDNYEQARYGDVSFIVTNTPPQPDGSLSLVDLEDSCRRLAEVIRPSQGAHQPPGHIVVIASTVPPGSMAELRSIFSKDVDLIYNPHFIALGRVIRDLTHPDLLIFGAERASSSLQIVYRLWLQVLQKSVTPTFTSFYEAELIKITLTPYLTMRIIWANAISEMCDHLPQTNVDNILKVVGMDRRINTNELKSGLPYGGDCYPKDMAALEKFCLDNDIVMPYRFIKSIRKINADWNQTVFIPFIKSRVGEIERKKIVVLGASYKPTYPLLNQSRARDLAEALEHEAAEVDVYDPMFDSELGSPETGLSPSVYTYLSDADIVVLAVAYPEFRSIKVSDLKSPDVPVIDIWRLLRGSDIAEHGNWVPMGGKYAGMV